jgi:predicted RNA polymerase sigma factor
VDTPFEQTHWAQSVALYDHLLALASIPIVALNRAIAIGEVQGAATALALVEELDLGAPRSGAQLPAPDCLGGQT